MKWSCMLIFALSVASASALARDDWTAFRENVAEIVARGESGPLKEQIETLEALSGAPRGWKSYWLSYIHYRRALLANPDEGLAPAMEACLQEAASAVGAAIEESTLHAESLALSGACHSGLASTGSGAGMEHGPRAGMLRDESLLIAPDNPRVLLLAGAQDLWTPVQWGGSPERAERRLKKALARFPAARELPPWQPRWGRSDALGHLALALDALDRRDQALALLDQARAEGDWNGWLNWVDERITPDRRDPD